MTFDKRILRLKHDKKVLPHKNIFIYINLKKVYRYARVGRGVLRPDLEENNEKTKILANKIGNEAQKITYW